MKSNNRSPHRYAIRGVSQELYANCLRQKAKPVVDVEQGVSGMILWRWRAPVCGKESPAAHNDAPTLSRGLSAPRCERRFVGRVIRKARDDACPGNLLSAAAVFRPVALGVESGLPSTISRPCNVDSRIVMLNLLMEIVLAASIPWSSMAGCHYCAPVPCLVECIY